MSYCELLQVQFESTYDIPPMRQGWIFPKHSILQPIFDEYMVEILKGGIYDRMKTNYGSANEICETRGMVPIDINFVAILFIILAAGIILSILLFILEKFGLNYNV